jgi:hypothetical protein
MDEPLVIITGAGASAELGSQGPIAQMSQWASHLCDRLAGHAEVLGLRPGMEAYEFEAQIGSFLRFARALDHLGPYLSLGVTDRLRPIDQHEQWLRQAQGASTQIQRAIFDTLHELFRSDAINDVAAYRAYGSLLRLLGNPKRFSVATTNYDPSVEIGLDEIGARPYSGLDNSYRRGQPKVVHLEDIASNDYDRTPVLYLHGRVGWYTDESGRLIAADPDHPFNPDSGVPALLLPDPEKVYDETNVVRLWTAFEQLLQQAERVLVLGHSLNDTRLVEALQGVPTEHLAITIFKPEEGYDFTPDSDALLERLRRKPHLIPMSFGPTIRYAPDRLGAFVEGVVPDHGPTSKWRQSTDA